MVSRRILYGLALIAALAFQITNNNYLAHLLLGLCITLPILSLLLSLPAALTCRLTLAAERDALDRGEPGQWLISADWRAPLPLPRLSVRLTEKDCLTGGRSRRRLVMSAPACSKPITRPADTAHCALMELRADRVRVCDYLGLFSIFRPSPRPARLLVLPIPADPGPLDLPQGQSSRPAAPTARPKGTGEDYELRDYRPGDPMRRVHWKLSTKRDELIVREPLDTAVPLPLLTFDRAGGPDILDRTLDNVLGLCRALLAVQQPHALLWLDGRGEPRFCPISDEKELRLALLDVLSDPIPSSSPSILDRPELIASPDGPVAHLHVTAGEEARHD